MKISIMGLGYVGAVAMACLARDGHELVGVDLDENKLDLIRAGRSPIVEEGIQELMAQVVASGRVRVTSDVARAVAETDLSFVCVGTPSAPNGSQSVAAVERVMAEIGAAMRVKPGYHCVVMRSTVTPGTMDNLVRPLLEKHSGKKADQDFGLGFQPEFLREGSSIKDYDNPPLTIVGSTSQRCIQMLRELYGALPCEFVTTSVGVAEIQKYACNAFHALKITFANEIARISEAANVDGREVMALICKDHRLNISPAYLRPGFAFGGSCLPKDLRAIAHLAKMTDVTIPMLGSVLGSNRAHIDHVLSKVMVPGVKRVGIIGLSFKAGTDDLRESPMVTVAERLIGKGYELRIYDPEVNLSRLIGANKRYIESSIPHIGNLMRATCAEVIQGADALIAGLSGEAIVAEMSQHMTPEQILVDIVGLPRDRVKTAHYTGACW